MLKTYLIAGVSALTIAGAAQAEVPASASTDMNLRAGPGEEFDVISPIAAADGLTVTRCIASGLWCEVVHEGTTGWAFAEYMAVVVDDQYSSFAQALTRGVIPSLPRAEVIAELDASADSTGASAVTGAAVGALIAGPAGAAAGAVVGAETDIAGETMDYVRANPVEPVNLEGDLVAGAGIPEGVDVYEVPNDDYYYAYVNGTPVLIDPETRQIVRVVE
ncbi:DUF1236 domain-containing protein [Palleronia abyssalis]|uniref:SH3b domain-containing protein n=1 Tax=Palleronia abyssalis TaxID=1501240 RepID=A0A2R8BYW6_9RHOB|nr:DUF1236 domain-containing protein [Palleronia abyssalis]SPJ25350.1 hypothetical protein PAA8504_03201 [Palleronia abyssalis]